MRRRLPMIAALTMLVAACSAGSSGPVATMPTPTTVTPSPSSTDLSIPVTSPTSVPSTTSPVVTSPPTTQPSQTTTTPTPATLDVAPWFFVDEAGHPNRTGAFLVPVQRTVPHTVAVGRASLEQLFAGPTSGELSGVPAISSTIPSGVRVLGLTITDGLATVDLSVEFGGSDTSPVVALRMAQVVFTLTSIPNVNEVLFRQDGIAIKSQTSEGQLVDRPVLQADYLDFAAALTVVQPVFGGGGTSPLHVTGFGAVFEAAFNWVLTDSDGLIIAEGNELTSNGTGWGSFDFFIDYEVTANQVGALIVYTNSAKDGSRIDIREYPVALVP
jgi:Sporulation and spore germination/Immunoglobulin-like domain of bacterial spore germination